MKQLLVLISLCIVFNACRPVRFALSMREQAHVVYADTLRTFSVAQEPAQAQTSAGAADTLALFFEASASIVGAEKKPPVGVPTDAWASTRRTDVLQLAAKAGIASKKALMVVGKQYTKARKKYPAGDTTILGLSPVMFFALLAVAAGIVLLFITGKSQFFAILTLVLLIGGLLTALASFLELI